MSKTRGGRKRVYKNMTGDTGVKIGDVRKSYKFWCYQQRKNHMANTSRGQFVPAGQGGTNDENTGRSRGLNIW